MKMHSIFSLLAFLPAVAPASVPKLDNDIESSGNLGFQKVGSDLSVVSAESESNYIFLNTFVYVIINIIVTRFSMVSFIFVYRRWECVPWVGRRGFS